MGYPPQGYGAPAPGYGAPPPYYGAPVTLAPPGMPGPPSIDPAKRIIAFIIDAVIIWIPSWIVATIASIFFYREWVVYDSQKLIASLCAMVLWFLYITSMEGQDGRTIGKKVMSVQIVRVVDRQPIGRAEATVRAGYHALYALPFYLNILVLLIDLIKVAGVARRTMGDERAGTMAIETLPTIDPMPPMYGAPPPGYGASPPPYGAPPQYGAVPPAYGAPPQYGAPPPAYGPPPQYGAPPPGPYGSGYPPYNQPPPY